MHVFEDCSLSCLLPFHSEAKCSQATVRIEPTVETPPLLGGMIQVVHQQNTIDNENANQRYPSLFSSRPHPLWVSLKISDTRLPFPQNTVSDDRMRTTNSRILDTPRWQLDSQPTVPIQDDWQAQSRGFRGEDPERRWVAQ